MDYKLALSLKEAGFSQIGIQKGNTRIEGEFKVKDDELIYIPTLEELIEACQKHMFDDRETVFSLKYWPVNKGWHAEQLGRHEIATTPTEAVAKLWLALNTK